MSSTIINCFDSHTHFWATGQVALGLKLQTLQQAADIKKLSPEPGHYRSHWLTGFGWNQKLWLEQALPDKKILDEVFGQTPVFFSRVDGHASWINSSAITELKKAGYDFSTDPEGGIIHRDAEGSPTGILIDAAHIRALALLPDFSFAQHLSFFETSQKIFNRAGFTHVRDLSMNAASWNLLRGLEDKKSLTVALDAFVTAEGLNDLDRVLTEIAAIKSDSSAQMRLQGVKIFIDGSLGSQTAFLSENYLGTDNCGILIWPAAHIKELVRRTWQAGHQVAIHCIGDQAAHIAVFAAREVSAEGVSGRLHLEHVQLLRPETVQMMKSLHVVCHLQPCHWLSDHSWLKQSLPPTLIANLFQWEALRKNKIPFFFGSDSPIEPTSLFNNINALKQSAQWGVPELKAPWLPCHSHPDKDWCASVTEFGPEKIQQVYFKSEALL